MIGPHPNSAHTEGHGIDIDNSTDMVYPDGDDGERGVRRSNANLARSPAVEFLLNCVFFFVRLILFIEEKDKTRLDKTRQDAENVREKETVICLCGLIWWYRTKIKANTSEIFRENEREGKEQ